MTAARLLRLYPRAWRERYAEEFLATVGPHDLRLQQYLDIISGAIDAWLSADVRNATRVVSTGQTTGETMTLRSMVCSANSSRYTTRDGLIGAGVMIAGSIVSVVLGTALQQAGWAETGKAVMNLGFLGSTTISMPFWLLKGQPWKAQVVIVGGTVAFLLLVGYVSAAT